MKTRNSRIKWLAITVLLLVNLAWVTAMAVAANAPQAVTLYVRQGGTGDCSAWANACELPDALGASGYGDQIWVAQGLYKPTYRTDPADARTATFQLVDGVELYGGFPDTGDPGWGDRNWETYFTVLSGDIDNNDITDPNGIVTDTANITGANSYHVIVASAVDSSTILDGFTITAGNANGGPPYEQGGGINLANSDPTLTNLTFSGNKAYRAGGGMYNESSNPTLTGVAFRKNATDSWSGGGGMFNSNSSPVISTTQFISNTGAWGGGMYNSWSSPTLTDVIFSGNETFSEGNGGGMHNKSSSSPALTDVIFIRNIADWGGGGGMSNDGGSSPTLTGVTFIGNHAHTGGGMVNEFSSNPTLTNCTFSGNTSGMDGGGMENYFSSPTLTDVTFNDNTAAQYGGGMFNWTGSPVLTDVIFSNNHCDGCYGGGMASQYTSSPALTNVIFSENTALTGGGMHNSGNSHLHLSNVSFSANEAVTSGGGIYNYQSSLELYNVDLRGNKADSGGGILNDQTSIGLINVAFSGNVAASNGGGMYNGSSSPELTNVTFSGNSAQTGGGISNISNSHPVLENTLVWGNTAAGLGDEIYDDGASGGTGFYCSVRGGYGGCDPHLQDTQTPFVDADGPDGVPGTPDDDLRLVYTSRAIDHGLNTTVPTTVTVDLGGQPRFFTDYDLDGDPEPRDDQNHPNQVDLGAYEAYCFAWPMQYAGPFLETGRLYRQGFHDEIADSQTVAETLQAYQYERSQGNLTTAKKAYELALSCADTVTQTRQAIVGIENVIWEQASGAMLQGNDQFVQAMDLTDAEDIDQEIALLEESIRYYHEAGAGYLELLASDYYTDFLATQPDRIYPITSTITSTQTSNLDVIRLGMAAAKKSRAYLELADRQFRQGNPALASQTLTTGEGLAIVDLTLLYNLWQGIVDEPSYQEITRNMADMDRLYGFIADGKNPLGYSADFVPLYYDPGSTNNNYQETKLIADNAWINANQAILNAAGQQQAVDDDYALMQNRYSDIISKYNDELGILCGLDQYGEIDLTHCNSGTLYQQILAVEDAFLRTDRVQKEMENLHKQIKYQVDARAEIEGIYDATAELINPETSETYTSMVEQETELLAGQAVLKGFSTLVNGFLDSAATGATAYGPQGAVLGFWGLYDTILNMAGLYGEEQPPKEEKLAEFQVWQDAQVLICEGQVKDTEFELHIKELMLGYGLLDIDLLVAKNNLQQEMVQLNGLKTRVEYLLAEKNKALAFTRLLYEDPAHRVLRDYYMELAQDSYDTALKYAFQAGQALEYETNLTSGETPPAPDPDALVGIRNVNTLDAELDNMNTAYTDWSQGKVPDDYLSPITLSVALGFEDMELPGIGWVTREEQFNAFLRDPSSRVDLDGDGAAESLRFNFYTSIHKGNPFFLSALYNDRITSLRLRVRGAGLGKNDVYVSLVWGGLQCGASSCGASVMRTEYAFQNGGPDDLRAYNLPSRTALVHAAAGEAAFPLDAENEGLVWLSVANSSWTLTIDMTEGPNQGFNLDGIDEMVLEVWHNAYPIQFISQNAQEYAPRPARAYQPMQKQRDLGILFPAFATDRSEYATAVAASTIISGTYAGIGIASAPARLPAIDLGLVLTETNGVLTGYFDTVVGVYFPATDPAHKRGPLVSGQRMGDTFTLESESFTTVITAGLTITRQVYFEMGVITPTGELLYGVYRETLAGLSPEPLEISGVFTVTRTTTRVLIPVVNFNAFPVVGSPPLTVQFNDLSSNDPTSWEWDFGDGSTSTERDPVHVYTQEGAYTVTLTVHNPYGSSVLVAADRILVYYQRVYLPVIRR